MVACFERLALRADRAALAHTLAMRSVGIEHGDPLHRAGRVIASQLDDGVGAGVAGGYHNTQHFIETMLSALYLSHGAGLTRDRTARVVTAALLHDLHHDGSRSADLPFRLEQLAASRAEPFLRVAQVTPELCDQLRALILATEPRTGVPYARACLRMHCDGAPTPDPGSLPAALERLVHEPELAFEAVLLAEADVLPSIGLTVEHGLHVQDLLAAEWNVRLDLHDKLRFVDLVRDEIRIASFFAPNIDALRQACLRGVASGHTDPADRGWE